MELNVVVPPESVVNEVSGVDPPMIPLNVVVPVLLTVNPYPPLIVPANVTFALPVLTVTVEPKTTFALNVT